jgi:hypothetical protein
MYARLVIQRDGQLEVLHSEEEMAGAFAPIESPDEALAYAVAVTGLGPEYGLSHAPNFEYFTDVIEDTTVTEEGDGYLVRLFHFRLFGCGPHEMLEFDLHVSRAGVIEQRERTALYKDPAMDNLCVD